MVVTLARAEASLAGMEVRVAPRCPARHLPLAEVPVGGRCRCPVEYKDSPGRAGDRKEARAVSPGLLDRWCLLMAVGVAAAGCRAPAAEVAGALRMERCRAHPTALAAPP